MGTRPGEPPCTRYEVPGLGRSCWVSASPSRGRLAGTAFQHTPHTRLVVGRYFLHFDTDTPALEYPFLSAFFYRRDDAGPSQLLGELRKLAWKLPSIPAALCSYLPLTSSTPKPAALSVTSVAHDKPGSGVLFLLTTTNWPFSISKEAWDRNQK